MGWLLSASVAKKYFFETWSADPDRMPHILGIGSTSTCTLFANTCILLIEHYAFGVVTLSIFLIRGAMFFKRFAY